MKRCTKSLIISEKQTKSRTRYYFMPIRMATVCVYKRGMGTVEISTRKQPLERMWTNQNLCALSVGM